MGFPTRDEFVRSDTELLVAFLEAVRDLLRQVVRDEGRDHKGNRLLVDELVRPMHDAFRELEEQQHFERLIGGARDLSAEPMHEHGLGGAQLRFKLAAVSFRESLFNELGGVFRFRWLLDTLEGLLDSIIDASGTGGAIKEIKEAIRNSGDDR